MSATATLPGIGVEETRAPAPETAPRRPRREATMLSDEELSLLLSEHAAGELSFSPDFYEDGKP